MLGAVKRFGHKRAIEKLVGSYEIPTFPAVAMQTLEAVRSPNASAVDVADVLSRDPGLTVRILGAVNSSAYGLRRRVDSLQQAVALLGMSSVESLVAAVAVSKTYKGATPPEFEKARFWRAAARRAALSQALAKRLAPKERAAGFTAALLQDMAVPLLASCRPEEYGKVRAAWYAGEATLVELERAVFGFTHADVGGWLCENWKLPSSLRDAVVGHHEPAGSVEGVPTTVGLVSSLAEGDVDPGVETMIAAVQSAYPIEREEIEVLLGESFEQAEELAQLLGG